MRILFFLLIIFSTSAYAQEEKTIFSVFKNLGRSDCQAFIDNGDIMYNASNKAANAKDWDKAFFYDEEAFHSYLKAFGHCDDEPDNKEISRSRIEDVKEHGRVLSCVYHISEAQASYQRSSLALEHLSSASISLKHAKQTYWSLDDAEKYCAYDESRTETVKKLRALVDVTVVSLEEHIAKYGEDGIDVPEAP